MEPVIPSVGWGVLHLFYRVDPERSEREPGAAKRLADGVASLEADGHQALCFVTPGHKADLGVMALGPDLARLHAFEQELTAAPLTPVWSYLSLTELSPYSPTEDDERARLATQGVTGEQADAELEAWRRRVAEYAEHRLHPRLPRRRLLCFYPMSKRRGPEANWYTLPFEERKRLMAGHGRIGRGYAGRVLQVITRSTGLDDWEWGVTLLADDPAVLADIVSEMRFDEVSARYSEFGPFVVGLVVEPEEALSMTPRVVGRGEDGADGVVESDPRLPDDRSKS